MKPDEFRNMPRMRYYEFSYYVWTVDWQNLYSSICTRKMTLYTEEKKDQIPILHFKLVQTFVFSHFIIQFFVSLIFRTYYINLVDNNARSLNPEVCSHSGPDKIPLHIGDYESQSRVCEDNDEHYMRGCVHAGASTSAEKELLFLPLVSWKK